MADRSGSADTEKAASGGQTSSGSSSKSSRETSEKQETATTASRANGTSEDAIELLKNDHRKVERLFAEYESASRRAKKAKLARQICEELMIHTMIEEEIFYPACREYLDDKPLDEAQVEHDTAKALINEIMEGSPDEPFFDAKVKVLAEVIKHHVAEEEKRAEGIFAKAKAAGMDPNELLDEIKERKEELEEEAEEGGLGRAEPRSFLHEGASGGRMQMQSRGGGGRSSGQGGRQQSRGRMREESGEEERGRYARGMREDERSRGRGEEDERRRYMMDQERERYGRSREEEEYRGRGRGEERGGGYRENGRRGGGFERRREEEDERGYR